MEIEEEKVTAPQYRGRILWVEKLDNGGWKQLGKEKINNLIKIWDEINKNKLSSKDINFLYQGYMKGELSFAEIMDLFEPVFCSEECTQVMLEYKKQYGNSLSVITPVEPIESNSLT